MNSVNYNNKAFWAPGENYSGSSANVTTVGSNGGSSYYGTYDQSGNVFEWTNNVYPKISILPFGGNIDIASRINRAIVGGSWANYFSPLVSDFYLKQEFPFTQLHQSKWAIQYDDIFDPYQIQPSAPALYSDLLYISKNYIARPNVCPGCSTDLICPPARTFSHLGFRVCSKNNPHDYENFSNIDDVNNPEDIIKTSFWFSLDDRPGKSIIKLGKVEYSYSIGTYPVTNCEYVAFLNSVDPDGKNTNNIYHKNMTSRRQGGIIFDNTQPVGSKYSSKEKMHNKPVTFVSWFSCARYCNWLHNNKDGSSSIEDGAYQLNNTTDLNYRLPIDKISLDIICPQNLEAKYYIPNINEWYKAAYYDPTKNDVGGYWLFATKSDSLPLPISADEFGNGPANSNYSCNV